MGSNPIGATMATIFKHKNEYYQCVNLKKKLKRLRIDESEIEILFEGELSQSDLEKKFLELTQVNDDEDDNENETTYYYFYNPKERKYIVSIYPDLEHLNENVNDYERISREEYREAFKERPS